MKKIIFALLLSLTPALAQRVNLNGNCYVNQARAICVVENFLRQPVYCEANVKGITSYGFRATTYGQGWIYPGQTMRLEVFAQNPWNDPLINANVRTNCRF